MRDLNKLGPDQVKMHAVKLRGQETQKFVNLVFDFREREKVAKAFADTIVEQGLIVAVGESMKITHKQHHVYRWLYMAEPKGLSRQG